MEPVFVYNLDGYENTRRFREVITDKGFSFKEMRFGLDDVVPPKSCMGIYEGKENVGAIDERLNLLYVFYNGNGVLSQSLDMLARSFEPR